MILVIVLLLSFLYWMGVDLTYLKENFWNIAAFAILFMIVSSHYHPDKKK